MIEVGVLSMNEINNNIKKLEATIAWQIETQNIVLLTIASLLTLVWWVIDICAVSMYEINNKIIKLEATIAWQIEANNILITMASLYSLPANE